nr:MAG TPA: hypothetical protein [Caudoviricetes sp.]
MEITTTLVFILYIFNYLIRCKYINKSFTVNIYT